MHSVYLICTRCSFAIDLFLIVLFQIFDYFWMNVPTEFTVLTHFNMSWNIGRFWFFSRSYSSVKAELIRITFFVKNLVLWFLDKKGLKMSSVSFIKNWCIECFGFFTWSYSSWQNFFTKFLFWVFWDRKAQK